MISAFTLLALFGALVASYTDIKYGLIKNKLTLPLFAVGVLGHLIVEGGAIARDLLFSVLLIFVFGYSFWRVAGWSAGEIKEFLFLAALLPRYPQELKETFRPVLGPYPFVVTIFINAFLAVLPFILLWGVYASFKKAKLKEFFEPLKKIEEVGINAAVFVAALLLSDIFNVSSAFAILLVIFSYKLKNRIKIILSLIVGIGFIYYRGDLFFVIKYFGALFVTIMLFKLLWNSMNIVRKEALHDLVKIQELKEGMILSEDIYIENDKIFSKGIKERVIKRGKGPAIEKQARGLTMEEIEKLRELRKQGKIEEISITKGIPFAPIVLVGLLISLTLGDLIMVMRHG